MLGLLVGERFSVGCGVWLCWKLTIGCWDGKVRSCDPGQIFTGSALVTAGGQG